MKPGEAPAKPAIDVKQRTPQVGDEVRYRTWGMATEAEPLFARVARAMGTRVNLSVLLSTGATVAEGPVEFDPTGILEGHWSWPRK